MDGKHHFDWSCEKWTNSMWSQGAEEYPTYSKMKEMWLMWSHLADSKTRYWRKEGRRQEDEEEGISSYWMIFRKREDAGSWNRKHQIALHGEPTLEESVDLPQDRLLSDWQHYPASGGVYWLIFRDQTFIVRGRTAVSVTWFHLSLESHALFLSRKLHVVYFRLTRNRMWVLLTGTACYHLWLTVTEVTHSAADSYLTSNVNVIMCLSQHAHVSRLCSRFICRCRLSYRGHVATWGIIMNYKETRVWKWSWLKRRVSKESGITTVTLNQED